jgi:hypothetical protein
MAVAAAALSYEPQLIVLNCLNWTLGHVFFGRIGVMSLTFNCIQMVWSAGAMFYTRAFPFNVHGCRGRVWRIVLVFTISLRTNI